MFEELAQAIDDLRVPVDGDAIAHLFALRDRLDAKLADAVDAFDRTQLWELDGCTSLTAWLRTRAGMTSKRAAATTATARRLHSLPVTARAWQTGELSTGQVDTILGAAGTTHLDTLAAHEAELVPALAALSTADTARAMAVWKSYAAADGTPPDDSARAVHLSATLDGGGAIDGTLSPEGYSLVKTALRVADSPDVDGEPARTPAQRRHDALIDICRYFLDHQSTSRGGRHRPHLNVIVDLDDLTAGRGGETIDGPHLDGPTLTRLLCDSVLHRVLTAGRSTHQPGWHAKLLPDATYHITDPTGAVRTSRPPGVLQRLIA